MERKRTDQLPFVASLIKSRYIGRTSIAKLLPHWTHLVGSVVRNMFILPAISAMAVWGEGCAWIIADELAIYIANLCCFAASPPFLPCPSSLQLISLHGPGHRRAFHLSITSHCIESDLCMQNNQSKLWRFRISGSIANPARTWNGSLKDKANAPE